MFAEQISASAAVSSAGRRNRGRRMRIDRQRLQCRTRPIAMAMCALYRRTVSRSRLWENAAGICKMRGFDIGVLSGEKIRSFSHRLSRLQIYFGSVILVFIDRIRYRVVSY